MPFAYAAKHAIEQPNTQRVRAKSTLGRLDPMGYNDVTDIAAELAVHFELSREESIYLTLLLAECLAIEKYHLPKLRRLLPKPTYEAVKMQLTPQQIFVIAEACDTREQVIDYLFTKFGVEV